MKAKCSRRGTGFCQNFCLKIELLGVVERLFGAAHKNA